MLHETVVFRIHQQRDGDSQFNLITHALPPCYKRIANHQLHQQIVPDFLFHSKLADRDCPCFEIEPVKIQCLLSYTRDTLFCRVSLV